MAPEFIAVLALAVVFCGAIGVFSWRQQTILNRALKMLAARSYGEFVNGEVKVAGAKGEPAEFDPGF